MVDLYELCNNLKEVPYIGFFIKNYEFVLPSLMLIYTGVRISAERGRMIVIDNKCPYTGEDLDKLLY